MANSDIAFWLISQRILPPIAVVIPLYVLFQQVGLLDTQLALIVTYVATNLPVAVWLRVFRVFLVELESAAVDEASTFHRQFDRPADLGADFVATFLVVLIFLLGTVPWWPSSCPALTHRRCRSSWPPRTRRRGRNGGRCPC